MYSLTLLLKAKKLLWFIYDLVTLSKTEFLNAPEVSRGKIKAKINLALVPCTVLTCVKIFQNHEGDMGRYLYINDVFLVTLNARNSES